MSNPQPLLIPRPRTLILTADDETEWSCVNCCLPFESFLHSLEPSLSAIFQQLEILTGKHWQQINTAESPQNHLNQQLLIRNDPSLPPQAYDLYLEKKGISIVSRDAAGAYHALQTLIQLARIYPEKYPHIQIHDSPAVLNRGYMIDISRNKVPTIKSLKALIDQLASLKYNQLQLYTEHTFAFSKHKTVWKDASPLTSEDILELDAYCTQRFIELIPNLNTFGHLERWLRHPAYRPLAECPNGWQRPDGYGMPWGSTLHPSPESENFIQGILDEYLPLFTSNQCNIGGDEPWELGTGRSRERCEREGKSNVYIDFINRIAKIAGSYKKNVQFWADIILENPTHITDLAPNLTGMVWGYEAIHPFEDQCKTMVQSKIPFYLAPGTSTWNSLGTRLTTALTNIESAARLATKYHAAGLLLTDWGDYGHHQPMSLSGPPIHFAAQQFWNPIEEDNHWVLAMSRHTFETNDPTFAQALIRLGQINDTLNTQPPNRSPLVTILLTHDERIDEALEHISILELETVETELQKIRSMMTIAQLHCDDREQIRAEVILSIEFLLWATDRGILYLQSDTKSLTQQQRNELTELIIRFETLWLGCNCSGGLDESVQRFKRLLLPFVKPASNTALWPPSLEH